MFIVLIAVIYALFWCEIPTPSQLIPTLSQNFNRISLVNHMPAQNPRNPNFP